MAEVESFTLDHTAVKAPYVRLINVESGPKGDQISNFDVRFVQPNSGEIPTSGLHTIEHLLASLLRDRIDGVIDCSPFGCRTGFHLIMWGTPSVREVTAGRTFRARTCTPAATTAITPCSVHASGAGRSSSRACPSIPSSECSSFTDSGPRAGNTGGTYPERMGPVVICDGAPEGAPPGGCHGLVD